MAQPCTSGAAVRLTIHFPFWVELFYSMDVVEVTKGHELEKQVQTAATDGRKLWVNVDHFNSQKLDAQVALLVHEIGHKMFLHPTRQGFRDAQKWNIACDYAINSLIKANGFTIDDDWLYDAKYDGWLAEKIYADLADQERNGIPPPLMPGKLRDLMQPEGLTPGQVSQQEQETQAVVDRAIANAKARGTMPSGIEQATLETFRAANEPWYNHLHRFMQSLRSSEYNWARLNRRTLRTHGFFSPHHYSEALGEVVIWIDASGSCYERALQAKFAEHVNAIMGETRPSKVVVYFFDTKCYPPTEFEAGSVDISLRPQGGGGTSFRGLFDQAEQDGYAPEVGIVLTDMMGSFPLDEPGYPVIWADIYGRCPPPPFGERIMVEV